tara:strand:- start:16 stop:558 length:543 start_codon:yes stop_codon:yes gene_type:complete
MSIGKTISSSVVHENPWWSYKKDIYSLNEGEEREYHYCQTNGAVIIIPVLEDGRLVLIRQYRYLQDKHSIEFACGGINLHEAPFEAAKRELLEETGMQAGEMMKIAEFEPASGYSKDRTHLYIASDLRELGDPQTESTEILETLPRRIDEFNQMIRSGEIWDGQTLSSWAIARDYIYNFI